MGIGGLVALAGAFIWAELASRFPEVGGQYVYLERAYHPIVGFLYGVALLFIINGGSLAAVAILFGELRGPRARPARSGRDPDGGRVRAHRLDGGERRRRAGGEVDQ